MEKTFRNNEVCFLFQEYKTLREIAKTYGISEATIREIIIRKLGIKTYLQIRKEKMRMTARSYNYDLYLSKRKTYATNSYKNATRNGRQRGNVSLCP